MGTRLFDSSINRCYKSQRKLKSRANRCNVVGCYILRPFEHSVACCWECSCAKFEIGQTSEPTTPNVSFVRSDLRSVAQQCWICLHGSPNIVGATHAHFTWFTKSYGLYSSHDALQVPTCICLHRSANTDATTPNIVHPLINVGSCFLTVLTAVYLNFLVSIVGTSFVPILSTYAPVLMLSGHSLS